MSLQIGTLYEKHADHVEEIPGAKPDEKTGEVKTRKVKRTYYEGLLQLATHPHLSGRVMIVPRKKHAATSPDWTVKAFRGGQWFEIGTAFNGELQAGGRYLNLYLAAPGMSDRINAKAWPNPDDPDHTAEEPAYRVAWDVKGSRPSMSATAPATNGAGASVPFDN